MPCNIGINSQTINGALFTGIMARTILPDALPVPQLWGRVEALTIRTLDLPPAWIYVPGVLSVDYAVNVDPTFLKPPERGGVR